MDVDIISDLQTLPVYSFKIYAAGLEALLGEEVDEAEKEIDVTAGLALDLVGVSLRPVTFFVGQGGLMSAIWSAPSELTPALQTNFLLQDHSERLHLGNGLVAELDVTGALSLGLEGSLSLSLWNKNAQSLIKNSAGLALIGSLSVSTPSFQVGIKWNASTQSYIDFRSDVNFYDGVVMCLQMARPSFTFRTNVTKSESCRGFRTRYRALITRSQKINAASYPLPGRNAENCRKLLPAT
jgi:microsomal triglyceride transfer protein large subunit